MSVSEPFVPEQLAQQIEYLIDNQDVYLVKAITAVNDRTLYVELHTGEKYQIRITPTEEL